MSVAQVGISVESIDSISSLATAASETEASNVSSAQEFSQKMVESLFNYTASFALNADEARLRTTETFVPFSAIQQWFTNFERRLQQNPNFWKSWTNDWRSYKIWGENKNKLKMHQKLRAGTRHGKDVSCPASSLEYSSRLGISFFHRSIYPWSKLPRLKLAFLCKNKKKLRIFEKLRVFCDNSGSNFEKKSGF